MKFALFIFLLLSTIAARSGDQLTIRVKEMSKMLSNKPVGFVPSINDRKTWKNLAKYPSFEKIVESATKTVKKKLPVMTDGIF